MTYDELCRTTRPADYAEGCGLSVAGERCARLLAEADARASVDDLAADDSWGSLSPDADREAERQWRHLLHEGKL